MASFASVFAREEHLRRRLQQREVDASAATWEPSAVLPSPHPSWDQRGPPSPSLSTPRRPSPRRLRLVRRPPRLRDRLPRAGDLGGGALDLTE